MNVFVIRRYLRLKWYCSLVQKEDSKCTGPVTCHNSLHIEGKSRPFDISRRPRPLRFARIFSPLRSVSKSNRRCKRHRFNKPLSFVTRLLTLYSYFCFCFSFNFKWFRFSRHRRVQNVGLDAEKGKLTGEKTVKTMRASICVVSLSSRWFLLLRWLWPLFVSKCLGSVCFRTFNFNFPTISVRSLSS